MARTSKERGGAGPTGGRRSSCPRQTRSRHLVSRILPSMAASFVINDGEDCHYLGQPTDDDPLVVTSIKVAPGGVRLHHAYRGGLLDHVTSLCHLAEKVVEHYPRLNRDWPIAGAILHDIGKVEELGTS